MKQLLINIVCFFFPLFLIRFLSKNKLAKKHPFPESTLIHRKQAKVLFEVEFNWYDKEFNPVTVVREVKSGKVFSISEHEMKEFKEYAGTDRNAGSVI